MIQVAEIKYHIIKNLGVLSESSKGWKKEVNVMSWNDRKAKVDIREWDGEHQKMGKGITLTKEELKQLREILNIMNIEELDID